MKVVCICDAGVPEMLMQHMKKLPDCDVTLYTEKTLTDIKSLTVTERTAERHGAEACAVSAELLDAVREAEILITHVAPVNRAVLDAAPNVKIVGVLRTGTENVNLDLCRERGIAVYNAEGRTPPPLPISLWRLCSAKCATLPVRTVLLCRASGSKCSRIS